MIEKKSKKIVLEATKIGLAFLVLLPVIVAIVVSFQSEEEVFRLPYSLKIAEPSWRNYIYALTHMNIWGYFKNTIITIVVCVPCQIMTALLAAYAFSYFQFPMKGTLFAVMTAAMMIPGETVTITLFKLIVKWGLVDTYAGLTIISLTSVGAVFMFRQIMLSVPKSLWEAAIMDGCGEMRYFFKILVPLCKSIIISQVMLSFIGTYNNYLWPLLVTTKDSMRTIQTGVQYLKGVSHLGITMAAVLIILIPPVVLFILGLDRIMEGVTAGAVKN